MKSFLLATIFFAVSYALAVSNHTWVADSDSLQMKELIVYFHDYISNDKMRTCLHPLQQHFKIKPGSSLTPLQDFAVLALNQELDLPPEISDFQSQLEKLSCVKKTSFNKRIKGNYSTFLNLHDSNSINGSVFKHRNQTQGRSVSGSEDMHEELRRELFLKGDYSNLFDEFELWKYDQHKGKGVKIAIFDSGISPEAEQYLNIAGKVDFTGEPGDVEATSHGTFIASVVGSNHSNCPGIAPDAEIYIFKVFNKDHDSYTDWFLNAFNYALEKGIDIINLSNGSSDFQDNPFIDKINEITGKGITVVSSIGNDGPEQGTLNNPADMTNVIGVGSLNQAQTGLAQFSSRGITTWNLLKEIGIIKPDVVTLGEKIGGLDINGGCTVSSGTSVSSGIISGSLALIISQLSSRPTPALIKRTILKNQNKLENIPFADQGSGVFNIENIHRSLIQDDPLATYVHPETLDLTSADYEPFSSLSFYSTMMPVSFNFTVIHPELGPPKINSIEWKTENEDIHDCLQLTFEWSQDLIPFYSLIRAKIGIKPSSRCQYAVAENETVSATVNLSSNETVGFNIVLSLVPTPERGDRILIDSFHNLKFPEDGYILRDSIFIDKHPYEWKGDHMFTNYVHLYKFLRSQGYFVEILNEPITCFDARNYAAFVMADGEKALSRNEVIKLRKDIETRGVGLVIVAEWSDEEMMKMHSFKSEFTGKTWDPIVGGCNLDSINTLLKPYGIMFKHSSYSGTIAVGEEKFKIESGAAIQKFPNKGFLFSAKIVEDKVMIEKLDGFESVTEELHPLIGIYDLSDENNNKDSGSILAIGDSYCIESAAPVKCFGLISEFLGSQKQKFKQSLIYSEEHRLRYDFDSSPESKPFKEVYRVEDTQCSGTSYFSLKDEMEQSFSFENTDEFLTKWKVTDDAKYVGESDDWFSNLQFKYEIIVLSAVAVFILCSLMFYIWYQRRRNINYMKIVPDVDI